MSFSCTSFPGLSPLNWPRTLELHSLNTLGAMLWARHCHLWEAIPSTPHPRSRRRNRLQGSCAAHCEAAGQGCSNQDVPAPSKCRKDSHVEAETGKQGGGWSESEAKT